MITANVPFTTYLSNKETKNLSLSRVLAALLNSLTASVPRYPLKIWDRLAG